jgi:class 3 adenylate cyclase
MYQDAIGPESPAALWTAALSDVVTVLLVTDLEAFTPLLVRLGDLEAQRVIRDHNVAIRSSLRAHGGVEVTHLGDGVMAAFCSVRCAIACAVAIQRALASIGREHAEQPLRARIGLHAGEPLAEDGRLFGICVNTAVRICDAAPAGSVLVSDVVRQLCFGHKLSFEDRGAFALKGLDHRVRLHRLISEDGTRSVSDGDELLPVGAGRVARQPA